MRKKTKMMPYNDVKAQLWAHYQHLLDRATELGYIYQTPQGPLYEQHRRGCYPIDQLLYTRQEIENWRHYQEQDKR